MTGAATCRSHRYKKTAVRRNHQLPHACWAAAQRQAQNPAAKVIRAKKIRHQAESPTTSRLLGDSPTTGVQPRTLIEPPRLLGDSPTTGAKPSSQGHSGKKNPPSGGITNYLTPVGRQPNDRRKPQQPRGDIAPLSGSFANETPGERTFVRDPGGERSKAGGSKRDRSVNHFFLDQESFSVTVRLKTLRSAVES